MSVDPRSVVEMQRDVDKQGKRSTVLQFTPGKVDQDKIAGWNQDLARLLHVFEVHFIGSVGNL